MAIALDSSSSSGGVAASPVTLAHTCTGTNLILFAATFQPIAADNVTGVTYNSVAMTKIGSIAGDGANNYTIDLWFLLGPATGAHNIVATASSGTLFVQAASYTGAKQSAQPDASNTNSTGSATSLTTSVTTIADNCWTIMACSDGGSSPAAGTGSTLRQTGLFDSNAALTPAGSKSMEFTWAPAQIGNAIMASFSPFIASTGVETRMMSMFD